MIWVIHPVAVPDLLDCDAPQAGCHVLEKVDGEAVPLWRWIEAQLASPWRPGKPTLARAVESFRLRHPRAQ